MMLADRSHTPKGQVARERILREATMLLAARGFHGTSMRDVADASEIALANVVYHFPRKEKLHAAVLGEIASHLLGLIAKAPDDPIRALVKWSIAKPGHVRLLMRELLDNPSRVSKASALPLAPVLNTLADFARSKGHKAPELAVLHIIGALSYVIIARPTVKRIVGSKRDEAMMKSYEDQAYAYATNVLATPHLRAAQRDARDDAARGKTVAGPHTDDAAGRKTSVPGP